MASEKNTSDPAASTSVWGGAAQAALPPRKQARPVAKSPGLSPTNSKAPRELSAQEGSGREFAKAEPPMKG